ncbi:MAG: hypothetical protein K1X57_13040 [Gemmataceae bacterium]|nr:hypothetical protein [Gemmataceae bacterium]
MIRCTLRCVAALLMLATTAPAQTPTGSVTQVPADALFYASGLRLGEQIDAFLKSNAYARLRALPAAKFAHEKMMQQAQRPGSELSHVMQFLQAPENAELMATVHDMFRNEMFVYGGEDSVRWMRLAGEMTFTSRLDRFIQRARNSQNPDGAIRNLLNTLKDNLNDIVMPDVTIGFRITNPAAAKNQLTRLETHLKEHLEKAPKELQGRMKRTKIGEADALVMTLDGTMVPWDRVNLEQYEDEKGDYKSLGEKLRKLTLTVTLAVKGEYVLLSFGPDSGHINKFGAGEALASRAEFAPLKKHADKRICELSYVSKRMGELTGTTAKDIADTVKAAVDALNEAPISDELRKKIAADIEKVGKEWAGSITAPAASMGLAFITPQGTEGFQYTYRATSAAPLTILDRVGGNPIVAVAGRTGDATPRYQALVRWIKVFYAHGLAVAKEMTDDNQYQQIQASLAMSNPFWQRFDEVTGTQLLPSLADGQQAIVLDGQWKSKQWAPNLDQKGAELPMLEFGLLMSVSDSAKLVEAFQGYRKFVNDLLGIARGFGAPIPEEPWPKPKTTEAGSATAFYWPIPDMGQDSSIVPNLAVSKNLLTVTFSTAHAARLHGSKPLAADVAGLANGQGVVEASWVDFAGLVRLARPWAEAFMVPAMMADARPDGPPGLRPADVAPQVATVFEVLGCIKNFTSATYAEAGATVTHHKTVVEDLKK